MLIFIENTPRAYAWGSRDALPELLGQTPTGEPQAELWLGDHPSAPASVAKASPTPQTLIELIESDPDLYGVNGKPLPFLLKVLAIGAPLSLQVHPDKQQAAQGYAREQAAGIATDARERNYVDANHKPELLVALSEVTALCGFRPLAEAQADLRALAAVADAGPGRDALLHAAALCEVGVEGERLAGSESGAGERTTDGDADGHRVESASAAGRARRAVLEWALGGGTDAAQAVRALASVVEGCQAGVAGGQSTGEGGQEPVASGHETVASGHETAASIAPDRLRALERLVAAHPADPGVLISLLLHVVTLQPGEAVYLAARQLHAYLGGIAVEVMAASDNVLRAGLTEKHVDPAELMRIVSTEAVADPRFDAHHLQAGLVAYAPEVPDFCLLRARLQPSDDFDDGDGRGSPAAIPRLTDEFAETVRVEAPCPLVLIVTSGRVRVERVRGEFDEVATARRGQSLYVSAGEAIELSGRGEVFLATVGQHWPRVSQLSSGT